MAKDRGELDLQAPIRIRLDEIESINNGPNEAWKAP